MSQHFFDAATNSKRERLTTLDENVGLIVEKGLIVAQARPDIDGSYTSWTYLESSDFFGLVPGAKVTYRNQLEFEKCACCGRTHRGQEVPLAIVEFMASTKDGLRARLRVHVVDHSDIGHRLVLGKKMVIKLLARSCKVSVN